MPRWFLKSIIGNLFLDRKYQQKWEDGSRKNRKKGNYFTLFFNLTFAVPGFSMIKYVIGDNFIMKKWGNVLCMDEYILQQNFYKLSILDWNFWKPNTKEIVTRIVSMFLHCFEDLIFRSAMKQNNAIVIFTQCKTQSYVHLLI